MGDIVPVASSSQLIVQDSEQQVQLREERIKEAQKLEQTLTEINQLPTRIYNVSGSCAGAGSGDFHYYRLIRRAEQDRLRRIEAEHKKKTEHELFESKVTAAQADMDARAAKKRAKRLKQKAKKKHKGKDGAAGGAGAEAADDSDSDGGEHSDAAAAAVPKQKDLD